MSANFVLLERITVGEAGAASVTFNNIPQSGYTDLKLVTSPYISGTDDYYTIGFNGSTSNFSGRYLFGNGSAASSGTITPIGYAGGSNFTSNTFGNNEHYIPNYTSTNYKSISTDALTENNGTTASMILHAGLWSVSGSGSPITSITLNASNGNFQRYSTFSLYGLAAVGTTPVIAPYASGGDIIETDGTYWYHAFLSSGTFTPAKALSCDVLVVAGGGSGGNGGGGSGQVLGYLANALTANTSYSATVGAGGTATGLTGTNGSTSQFASLIASVGGGAGGANDANGANGASSGGGGGSGGVTTTGGTASSGGTGGGNNGVKTSPYPAGGGGGFGGNGGNGSGSTGGTGGAGVNTVTNGTWLSTALSTTGLGVSGYIAGGGGGAVYGTGTGGAGGSGGGGAGSGSGSGTAGTANTGSGGGGANNTGTGGKGGSGLVILRYAI